MVIVALDTILWLSICWGLSAPMILSGLYEALLDSRVIEFVREKIKSRNLTLDIRRRLLMLVLIGNLDLAIEDDPCSVRPAQEHQPSQRNFIIQKASSNPFYSLSLTGSTPFDNSSMHQRPPAEPVTPGLEVPLSWLSSDRSERNASPWRHMEELLYPIRLYDDEDAERNLSPRQYAKRRHSHNLCHDRQCTNFGHFVNEQPHTRAPKIKKEISKTKTRLRTMLNCQYSFGSMVGAPVVFFLSGFIFAFVQNVQELGSEDIALALAFGQWYMTIPHIAIVSGLLLAGNNPSILEGVFATQREAGLDRVKFLGLNFGLAYPSCYKVAWPDVTVVISSNTKEMINDAQIYWEPCGITAIAFMTFVSFVGWWYQRRMKDLFTTIVSEVDLDKYDR
ncbi:hypothetical protein F5883DRAFT_642290 [Diaporthe sp. PMI_573]|nr:hypothetical protein F5883DRAFT_642290 [Diaporthaceae sp. PMI_573]